MEIEYVPFLKSKQNEVHALAELDKDIFNQDRAVFRLSEKAREETRERHLALLLVGLQRQFKKAP